MSDHALAQHSEHSALLPGWTRTHSWMMASFALGMIIESYIYSVGSVATGWVAMPKALTSLLLAWSPLWLIIGIGIAGPVSDRIGRKRTFYFTMAMYVIGGVLILIASTYWMILLALAILLAASGGEMNTIMTQAQEMLPTRYRTSGFYMVINAVNFGALLLGVVAFANVFGNVALQRTTIGLTLLLAVVALLVARSRYPESLRWLERSGRRAQADSEARQYMGKSVDEAIPEADRRSGAGADQAKSTSWLVKLVVVVAVAWANTTGYGLLTLVLGPYYYPKDVPAIILISGLGGVIGGCVIAALASRIGRKSGLFYTDLLTLVMTILVIVTLGAWTHNLALFFVLLFVLNFFSGINYIVEDTLKTELWPTLRRGTLTSVARFVSIGLYIPVPFLTAHFSLQALMIFNTAVWVIGSAAALLWYVRGHETGKGVSIEVASGEALASA